MDAIQARDLDTVVSLADDGTPFQHTEQAKGLDLEALAIAMDALESAAGSQEPDDADPAEGDTSTEAPWFHGRVREPADRAKS